MLGHAWSQKPLCVNHTGPRACQSKSWLRCSPGSSGLVTAVQTAQLEARCTPQAATACSSCKAHDCSCFLWLVHLISSYAMTSASAAGKLSSLNIAPQARATRPACQVMPHPQASPVPYTSTACKHCQQGRHTGHAWHNCPSHGHTHAEPCKQGTAGTLPADYGS